jgi:hypothetical protein
MTHYEGDIALHRLATGRKSVHQITQPVAPPIGAEADITAAIQDEQKDEEILEYQGIKFQLSHISSLREDESFYVSLWVVCRFYIALTVKD